MLEIQEITPEGNNFRGQAQIRTRSRTIKFARRNHILVVTRFANAIRDTERTQILTTWVDGIQNSQFSENELIKGESWQRNLSAEMKSYLHAWAFCPDYPLNWFADLPTDLVLELHHREFSYDIQRTGIFRTPHATQNFLVSQRLAGWYGSAAMRRSGFKKYRDVTDSFWMLPVSEHDFWFNGYIAPVRFGSKVYGLQVFRCIQDPRPFVLQAGRGNA